MPDSVPASRHQAQSDRRGASARTKALWLATALVLAAFVLRVIDLDRRPLHFDEGINVTFGQNTPAQILALSRATFDNDPPGHRMAMGVWMALAGPSAVSIRLLSVGFSLLMVAGLYRLLRRMQLQQTAALFAAALIAVSPYAIDYAQQAKGYAMGAGLAAVSWLIWTTLVSPDRLKQQRSRMRKAGVFITYVVATALALSTHYYVLLLLPMQWLWFFGMQLDEYLLSRNPQTRRASRKQEAQVRSPDHASRFIVSLIRGAVGQALAILPIGIWLALMATSLQISTARSSTKFNPASPLDLFPRILAEMSAGQFVDTLPQRLCGVLVFVLAIVGAVRLWHASETQGAVSRRSAFWFGTAFLVPLAGAIVMQQRVTFFFPRFLVYALPSLFALVAGCVLPDVAHRMKPALRFIPAILAMCVMIFGSAVFYRAPIDAADDYRPLIAQMRPYIQPGDAALGTYIWMEGMFDSYAPETNAAMTWYMESYSPATIDAQVAPIAKKHARVWSMNFLRNPDAPDTLSNQWLKQNAAYVQRFTAGTTTAVLFDMGATDRALKRAGAMRPLLDATSPTMPVTSMQAISSTIVFGDLISLQYSPVNVAIRGGDSVPVALTWTALKPIPDHYLIFVHLMTDRGELAAQNDGDAVNGMAPSFTWTPGMPVADRRAIAVPPMTKSQYTLEVGLFRESDGLRLLTVDGADSVPLGNITVAR